MLLEEYRIFLQRIGQNLGQPRPNYNLHPIENPNYVLEEEKDNNTSNCQPQKDSIE
jgi:hypothetical protein